MGMFLCNTTGIGGLGWGAFTPATLLPFKHYDTARLCVTSIVPTDNPDMTLLGALHFPFWLFSLGSGWYLDSLMLIVELAIVALILVPLVLRRRKSRRSPA